MAAVYTALRGCVKPIGKPNLPWDMLTSVGIPTDPVGETDWDCPGKTTRESLLASVERHARSVTIGQRRITTTRTRPDDDGDNGSGNRRSHNIVITSTSCNYNHQHYGFSSSSTYCLFGVNQMFNPVSFLNPRNRAQSKNTFDGCIAHRHVYTTASPF